MKHFHAGYILDIVAKKISLIEKDKELLQIKGLLQHITSFDVQFPHAHDLDFNNLNPFLATLNNIITRGLPTKAPLIVERKLSKILGKTVKNPENEFEVNYIENNYSLSNNIIFELLHIIEPKFSISKNEYLGQLGSNAEWIFIDSTSKEFPFAKQIFKSQRLFSTIADGMGGERSVDFCFQSPYLYWNPNKDKIENISRIIEVDGPHHEFWQYRIYDKYRDAVAEIEGFETLRVPVTEIKQDNKLINSLFKSPIYVLFEKNYNRNLKEFIDEYILIFSPVAIARIQKTLIEYFLTNLEILKQPKINIAIIERDVPCGALSIENLDEYFTNLNALLRDGSKLELPKIELTIFPDNRFLKYTSLHLKAKIGNEIYFNKNSENYDIIIDHSILRRSCIYKENNYLTDNKIIIRSSHYSDNSFGNSRRVYCAEPLQYKPLVKKQNDGSYSPVTQIEKNINFFIENIFRKTRYWPGQLPIISRALQHLPVIGLLPTGGGKSLTFQLSVLMQPGLCVVVDPIKSLMEDQVRVLKDNWIDCCEYINSTIPSRKKRERLINYRYGESQMLFVSPERFVMKEFRDVVKNINSFFGLAITFCVIDEVHCVSEWGHDFRTTYLSLGKNAQKKCATKNKSGNVTLVGLTATASFDVLTDIERELQIKHDDVANAIISIDNTIRPELFFNIIETNGLTFKLTEKDQNIKDIIGKCKQVLINDSINELTNILKSIDETTIDTSLKQHFTEFEINFEKQESDIKKNPDYIKTKNKLLDTAISDNSKDITTIIFCPHTKGSYGVTERANKYPNNREIFENLNINHESKGFFMGGDDEISVNVIEQAQKDFVDFVNGKKTYMVCTKAFGMGIDKEDIRAIYHINFTNSPESYIQEAGRAGRDKGKSLCTIIIDRNKFYKLTDESVKNLNRLKLFPTIQDRLIFRNIFEQYKVFNNRIYNVYHKSTDSILNKISSSHLPDDLKNEIFRNKNNDEHKYLVDFYQDKDIHDFFHKNSYKGIETEIYQIYRFFNESFGINEKKIKLLEVSFNAEQESNFVFYLTPDGNHIGNLWINNSDKFAKGKILTTESPPHATIHGLGVNVEPDLNLTNEILVFLLNKYETTDTNLSFFNYLNQDIEEGLNHGKSLKKNFEECDKKEFEFEIPVLINTEKLEERIKNDFNLPQKDIFFNRHNIQEQKSVEDFLKTIKDKSSSFEDFILRVEEHWNCNIFSSPTYQNNRKQYKEFYYSTLNKSDISRIIYRLMCIAFVGDYTIDYNKNIFKCTILKTSKEEYIKNTSLFINKYISNEKAKEIITKLRIDSKKNDDFNTILKCIRTILEFTYNEVVAKRKRAAEDMYTFIIDSIERGNAIKQKSLFKNYWYNHYLKEDLYYYFNAKYARKGFKIDGMDYSLTDDSDEGRLSEWKTFIKYGSILNKQSSFISECKMMRGSCRRIRRTLSQTDLNDEWVLKLLYSFATYGLNNAYYLEEASQNFLDGFRILYVKKSGANNEYDIFKKYIIEFENLLIESVNIPEIIEYFYLAKHSIMIEVNLSFTSKMINNHNEIKILHS